NRAGGPSPSASARPACWPDAVRAPGSGQRADSSITSRFFLYYGPLTGCVQCTDQEPPPISRWLWDCGRGGSTLPPGLRKVIPQRWPRSDLVPDSGHLARKRARLRLRDGATGAGPRDRFVTVTAETGGTGCVTGGRRPREAAGGQDRANRRGARQGVPAQAIGPGSARALKRPGPSRPATRLPWPRRAAKSRYPAVPTAMMIAAMVAGGTASGS